MNKKITIFLILLIIILVLPINAKVEGKLFAHCNGNVYLKLNKTDKCAYVVGLIDMLYHLMNKDYPAYYNYLVSRTENMTPEQTMAIFDKYLEEHPEEWHFPCSYLFCEAINEFLIE
jgi:hypothetical protein